MSGELVAIRSEGWDIGWAMKGFNGPMRRARLLKGLSQKQLADIVDTNVQMIGRIELLLQRPKPKLRFQIADFLGLDEQQIWPDWLEPRDQSLSAVAYQEVDAKTYSMLDASVRREIRQLESPDPPLGQSEDDQKFMRKRIDDVLSTLTYREREIVKLRFGLNDENAPYTLEECGRIFKITRERVKQIEAKALRKLSDGPRADVLAECDGSCDSCPRCGKCIARTRYCHECHRVGCHYCMKRITDSGKYVYVCTDHQTDA